MVLESNCTNEIIDILQQKLNQIDDEIIALSTIRSIFDPFIARLNENIKIDIKVDLLDDNTIIEFSDTLTVAKLIIKE